MTIAVVLGAAVRADGSASPTLRRRTLHAVALYKQGKVGKVICSGGIGRFPPSEAAVMHEICLAEGLPAEAIVIEDQARSTLENLSHTKRLLKRLVSEANDQHLLIITDHYHKWRALLTARHLGLSAQVSCPALNGTTWPRVIKAWLREMSALIYYWWKLR